MILQRTFYAHVSDDVSNAHLCNVNDMYGLQSISQPQHSSFQCGGNDLIYKTNAVGTWKIKMTRFS